MDGLSMPLREVDILVLIEDSSLALAVFTLILPSQLNYKYIASQYVIENRHAVTAKWCAMKWRRTLSTFISFLCITWIRQHASQESTLPVRQKSVPGILYLSNSRENKLWHIQKLQLLNKYIYKTRSNARFHFQIMKLMKKFCFCFPKTLKNYD